MKLFKLFPSLLFCFVYITIQAEVTEVVVLNSKETERLKGIINTDILARAHFDSLQNLAQSYLSHFPNPPGVLHYEGLLQTNPKRMETEKKLEEIEMVVNLVYVWYVNDDQRYIKKIKDFVLAWSGKCDPSGNTINDNKLVPLFWAYYLTRSAFTDTEQQVVDNWIRIAGELQKSRPFTPDNNWEAKRLKIIAAAGCILGDTSFMSYSIDGLKKYIGSAYYADGTSNDLKERDALHYHVSGLKPLLDIFINCIPFNPEYALYDYIAPNGASVQKAVEYVYPYASGQQKRKEWVNSTAEIDRRRAAAGLDEYQPGMLFDASKALPLFQWASYYNEKWYQLLGQTELENGYSTTWIGLLNSPLIRGND